MLPELFRSFTHVVAHSFLIPHHFPSAFSAFRQIGKLPLSDGLQQRERGSPMRYLVSALLLFSLVCSTRLFAESAQSRTLLTSPLGSTTTATDAKINYSASAQTVTLRASVSALSGSVHDG